MITSNCIKKFMTTLTKHNQGQNNLHTQNSHLIKFHLNLLFLKSLYLVNSYFIDSEFVFESSYSKNLAPNFREQP